MLSQSTSSYVTIARTMVVILMTFGVLGCVPVSEEPCFNGVDVNLKLENDSERQVKVFSYGQFGRREEDATRGLEMVITSDQTDDQMTQINSLEPVELFTDGTEKASILLGQRQKGKISTFLLELVFDDGRSTRIAGWPERYQALPDVVEYEVGYVDSSERVLISKLLDKGDYQCSLPLLVTLGVDESISLSRWK